MPQSYGETLWSINTFILFELKAEKKAGELDKVNFPYIYRACLMPCKSITQWISGICCLKEYQDLQQQVEISSQFVRGTGTGM